MTKTVEFRFEIGDEVFVLCDGAKFSIKRGKIVQLIMSKNGRVYLIETLDGGRDYWAESEVIRNLKIFKEKQEYKLYEMEISKEAIVERLKAVKIFIEGGPRGA